MRPLRRKDAKDGSKRKLQIELSGVSVFIAMPVHRDLPVETVHSLLATQGTCQDAQISFQVHFEYGCSLVEVTRSLCVHNFLKTKLTKLFWIDSDMQWSGDDFLRMLAMSCRMDVVCASYPTKAEPLVYQLNTLGLGAVEMNEWDCIPAESGGLGFCVVDRKVIEELSAASPPCEVPAGRQKGEAMRHIFRIELLEAGIAGEDTVFFNDIRKLGYEVWCDPHIKLGHVGSKVYGGDSLYEHTMAKHRQLAAAE